MVFDYYVDDATCSMVPWEGKVPSFSYMPDSFSSLFVPTVDTTRLTYFLDTLIAKKHYVMFVGNTGELVFKLLQATSALSMCLLLLHQKQENYGTCYHTPCPVHRLCLTIVLDLALPFNIRI